MLPVTQGLRPTHHKHCWLLRTDKWHNCQSSKNFTAMKVKAVEP